MKGQDSLPTEDIVKAIKKVEEHIYNNIQRKIIPGCAIAIVYRNKIIYMNGYGFRTVGKPDKIDVDTVFQLGSVSKPIAATLASILEQKGLINLDDPIQNYLPNFILRGQANAKDLKVKNILSHTSGVPRGGFNNLIEKFTPYKQIVHSLQTTTPIAPVGRRYDYHNAMYGLISDVTYRATRRSFSETLSTYLLRPLNMNRTSSTLQGLISTANRATPHTRVRNGLRPATPYSSGYYTVAPAGGINSSVRDMASFLKAQMGAFPEILSNKALNRIQTPYISTHNMLHTSRGGGSKNPSYGLGWRIQEFAEQKLVYHGGWVKGFTNIVAFLPQKKLGIVILHNGDSKFSAKTATEFFEIAMGLKDTTPTKISPRSFKKERMKSMKRFKTNSKASSKVGTKSKIKNKSKNKKSAGNKGKNRS